jgi:hypothetical protein
MPILGRISWEWSEKIKSRRRLEKWRCARITAREVGQRLSYGHCFCCPHPAIATVAIHYFFILGMGY